MHPQGERGKIHCKFEMIDTHVTATKNQSSNSDGQPRHQRLVAQAEKNAPETILSGIGGRVEVRDHGNVRQTCGYRGRPHDLELFVRIRSCEV